MPAGDNKFASILQLLENESTDRDSFILGVTFGGLVMALGLQPVVDQVKAIFANKDATIAQLTTLLNQATANAITPADQSAFAALQAAVVAETTTPPPAS